MIELTYISRAQRRFNSEELKEMLSIFRRNNQKKNITGLLLYDGYGTFIQSIIGEEEVISSLFTKISQDTRHSRINILGKVEVSTRAFPDWRMGFKNLKEQPIPSLQGFSDFMQQESGLKFFSEQPSFAMEMLEYFKSGSSLNLDQDQV